MNLGYYLDKFLKKNWTEEELDKYLGPKKIASYLGYSLDPDFRKEAASGGTTSRILVEALEQGLIDGAVLCKSVIEEGNVRARFYIAKTREEILAAQGSKYVATKFLAEALPLIREFQGRLAVTGLPCDISHLTRWMEKDTEIGPKVILKIVLVCGHNSRPQLVDGVVKKLSTGVESPLTRFQFRIGHWRGTSVATYADGTRRTQSYSRFGKYQNLFYFSEKKCLACNDHFGYDADISIGDVWIYRLKKEPIKHNGILIRTPRGEELFQKIQAAKILHLERVPFQTLLDGQARIAPFHYNVSARVKAGEKLAIKLVDHHPEKVKWHEYLAAYLAMKNFKETEKMESADPILAKPGWFIKLYLYFIKGLESIK
jgi:coenzyme F420-reducing hydrogenase beta subunit